MNEAVESLCVSEEVNEVVPVPARVPGTFVVDLLEETGRFDRGEAELLLSWFEWVEMEVGDIRTCWRASPGSGGP
jgi:hypothetical protein